MKKPTKKSRTSAELHDLYMNIFLAFTRNPLTDLPMFAEHYEFVEYDDKSRVAVSVDANGVLSHIVPQALIDSILRYTQFAVPAMALKFLPRNATECYQLIKSLADPIPHRDILPIAELKYKGYCWHKLPFDIVGGECPTFNELAYRTTAPDVLKAFIGSLFFKDSDRHQYLWLYGSGRNGKSRLAQMMRRIMGPSYKQEVVPDRSMQRFWTSGIINKRLVVFDDCNNYGFPASGFFKALTGGEATRIERKGIDCYDAELTCKFMFLSNEIPEVHYNAAEIRRALYIEVLPITGSVIPTKDYDERLWLEAPHVIADCMEVYKKTVKDHAPIPAEAIEDSLLGIIEDTEEKFLEAIHKQWQIDTTNPNWYATTREFNEWFVLLRISKHDERHIRKILMNRYNIRSDTRRIDGVTVRCYPGLKDRNMTSNY